MLRVRLTPKAARDSVAGVRVGPDGPRLEARVRAVPQDGKANAALERLLAEWLGVPRTSVAVVAGGRSRSKRVRIEGHPSELLGRLAEQLATGNEGGDDGD